jgi:hypothetical protein
MGNIGTMNNNSQARAPGYSKMRLDTLNTMGKAQCLYRRHGFVEIPQYTLDAAIRVRLDLWSASQDPAILQRLLWTGT